MKGLFETSSVEETWRLAAKFAQELKRGDIICLEGELGAGKTTFIQGLAAALGVAGRVTSPTFCIVREHLRTASQTSACDDEPLLLVHMDLYRLGGEEDVEAIGWDEYLARGAIIAVEWPERAGSLIPQNAYHIRFAYDKEFEEKRRITIDLGT
ncbi:MAG: tRNA (adenosine(37)-N6)-threonylcarbamoyltransferase complex ATPase subunit type 1 TsaE [Kiritimatiellae bacterium]|nr:tRNA (adenosine(37)-N6)-threonylcarbamoyltransferase complex ATPase subunit type 1 TsaE [Kiritimatiellia bacterium]